MVVHLESEIKPYQLLILFEISCHQDQLIPHCGGVNQSKMHFVRVEDFKMRLENQGPVLFTSKNHIWCPQLFVLSCFSCTFTHLFQMCGIWLTQLFPQIWSFMFSFLCLVMPLDFSKKGAQWKHRKSYSGGGTYLYTVVSVLYCLDNLFPVN